MFGLWGIAVLAPILARSVYPWLEDNLGFLPFFDGTGVDESGAR